MKPFPAFATSLDHVLAELERVDLMIRARVAHLRRVQQEDEHFRGLYISEQEVDALLERPRGAPQWLDGNSSDPAADAGRLDAVDDALRGLAETLAARRSASLAAGIELRLHTLARIFELDAFDVDVLLVCLAVETDLRYEKLYAYLQDDVTRKRPSVDLVIHLLGNTGVQPLAARRHFFAASPLLRHRLVRLLDDPSLPHPPLLARFVKPDDRIVRYLLNTESDDHDVADDLRGVAQVLMPTRGLDDLLLEPEVRSAWRVALPADAPVPAPVVLIDGPSGAGKSSLAAALCFERGCPLLVVDAAAAALAAETLREADSSSMRWDRLVTSIEREAALRHAAVLWRGFDGIAADAQRSGLPALWRAIDVGRVPCFVSDAEAARNPSWFARRGAAVMRVPLASHEQRTAFWAHALDGAALSERVDLAGIATRFKLTYGRIDEAASTARRLALGRGAGAAESAAIAMRDLQDACRLHSNQRLTSLARKTAAHHQWSDIVLPADRLSQLREICNHVKYRDRVYGEWGFGRKLALGKGLAVLFAGPSGTGKTMAAGIIASELGLDLYKIDLSTVISKYIGETEKNLSRIFDEAETSNAILFFDEADALFGKRSEVRDSHDRYANIEVGYLLQRMEEYEGIAILATNFRKNMDDAFVRRLHFTVEFPFPDERDRHRIWQGIWPADMPREDELDLELLAARYEMTGGNIKNVALAAAFLAADDEDPVVRMSHVVRAVLREYQKTGKLMGDYGERVAGDDPVRR